ncbi:hypothetical protein B0920_17960 [Massilia sp. KIM]|uniref:hypothetical protein n=1 Tax=Massilia sp. KIM TaxID=1955422 RepID=UPI00099027A9|nr:hypothetical protein [Massilia sp. KIM]OON60839.1 hypothetical protein B0920_17960 [Massilia sp. KIM]
MAYRWETPASIWQEDERTREFALLATDGLGPVDWQAHARARLPDLAHLLGASLPSVCECSPIYPEGFAHCPDCGSPLQRLSGAIPARQPGWWGPGADQLLPRHVPHGLPVTALALGDSIEERPAAPFAGRADRLMPAPPNAYAVFAAARYGFPEQRLLALAPGRGVLQYWDPLAQLWHVLAPEDGAASLAFTASDYAWLPREEGRRGEVALLPTAGGLQRLWINPISETYRLETAMDAPVLAAPGLMRRHIACLVGSPGHVFLWNARLDLSEPQQLSCPELPAAGWSRPFGYDGRLFWLHEAGQLVWRPGDAPGFLPWPPGWQPRLDFGGPTQSRDGRLWHIGHDGQGYSFLELGSAQPAHAAIDGARLGFANFLFRRGHPVVDEPWSAEHVEDLSQDDSLVVPLLRSFNNNRSQPSGLVLRLHKYTGRAEEALDGRVIPRVTVEWIGRRNVILDEIARLARPLDCVPLVYDGHLWLHHPDWNQMRGWRLDELA